MQLIETSSEGLKRAFKVTVPAGALTERVNARLAEMGASLRLPGFRPGRAPMSILRQRYAKAVLGEVVQSAVEDGVRQALADRNLRPAQQPSVEVVSEVKEGADLEFTIAAEVLPTVPEFDFSAVELERPTVEVADEDVDRALEQLAKGRKTTEPMTEDRAAREGDTAVIDFAGTTEDGPIQGGTGEDFHLELGSKTFIPGFEDAILGARPGDKVVFNVTFPENYHADLAGKRADFEVDIKELRQPAAVALDDEFAKGLGFDTLVALRDFIRGRLAADYAAASRAKVKRVLLDKLSEASTFDVPASMVEMEFDAIWRQVVQAKEKGTLEAEDQNKSDEELRASYLTLAERRVRLGLFLADVGERNKITVTQQDLSRALMAEASRYSGQEKMVIEYYRKHPEAMDNLRAPIFEDKIVDHIIALAKVTDVPVTREELIQQVREQESGETEST